MKIPKSKAKNAYELLGEVRALILTEPKRYNQQAWLVHKGSDDPEELSEFAPRGFPRCGTVGCVAGWTESLRPQGRAAVTLGLTQDQAGELFYYKAVDGNPQTTNHARRGAAHIARFQKEYAEQLKATKV